MKKFPAIILLIIGLSVTGVFGSDDEDPRLCLYLIGAANWVPYLNDTGLNYSVDYYNQNHGSLSQNMGATTSLLGYTAGLGLFIIVGNGDQDIDFSVTYSGLYSSPVRATFGNYDYLELRTAHGIIGVDASYAFDFSFFSLGAGIGLDFDFMNQHLDTYAISDYFNDTLSLMSGRVFLLCTILPFHDIPLFIYLKPYYTLCLNQSYDKLFYAMNNVSIPAGDSRVMGNLNYFGIQIGVHLYLWSSGEEE